MTVLANSSKAASHKQTPVLGDGVGSSCARQWLTENSFQPDRMWHRRTHRTHIVTTSRSHAGMPQQVSDTLQMHACVDQQTPRCTAQVVEGQGRQAGGLAELPESPSDVPMALRGACGGQEHEVPPRTL